MDDYNGVRIGIVGRVVVVCMREIARGGRIGAEREFIYTMPAVVQQYMPPFPAYTPCMLNIPRWSWHVPDT